VTLAAVAAILALSPPGFAQEKGEDESLSLVQEGRAALRRRDYAAAAEALDEALRLNPRRLEAYVLRAAVFASRKEYRQGISLMRRAQQYAPTDIDILTALGSHLMLGGQADEGVELLQAVIERDPDRYDAHLLLAQHYHRNMAWQPAIRSFETYLQARPADLKSEDPDHEIVLGDCYLRSQQPTKALALFRRAQSQRQNDLRAQVGIAWATAATDCARAQPLLARLAEAAPQFADVLLVQGRCELAQGNPRRALALARRYLQAGSSAQAHALVGDAEAVEGNLAAARTAFAEAHRLEPSRRLWPTLLATLERKAGDPATALATLERSGAPPIEDDPRWWHEFAEVHLALGNVDTVIDRLTLVSAQRPDDPRLPSLLGEAYARKGELNTAIDHLDRAASAQKTADPRTRQWLAFALAELGTRTLAAGDAARGQLFLARAAALSADEAIIRNLGAALLALGHPGDAAAVLDPAARSSTDAITWLLLARSLATTSPDRAPAAFARAQALASGEASATVAIELASHELQAGRPQLAVDALAHADPAAKSGSAAVQVRFRAAKAAALHAAGIAAMNDGAGERAVALLGEAATLASDGHAARCDLALATVMTGDREAALRRLRALSGKSCPFPAPADVQAVPILIAFTEGLQERRAVRSLEKLAAFDIKSTGPTKQLISTAIRVLALRAADEAYRKGQLTVATRYLAQARQIATREGSDELAHNQAVLDIASGNLGSAEATLERLSGRVPEAWINLGVILDRAGDAARALDAWRNARRAGVRFAPLGEWIESKEKFFGGAP
jgi:tetratricopeptide (TPR) repeat protein